MVGQSCNPSTQEACELEASVGSYRDPVSKKIILADLAGRWSHISWHSILKYPQHVSLKEHDAYVYSHKTMITSRIFSSP
jgi:hypothetical protein